MTDMNHDAQPGNNVTDAAPVGSRSERMRPQCVDDLIKALDEGKLDGRTREARTLETVKSALEDDLTAVAIEILNRQIASIVVILNAIEREIFRDASIIEGGKLNPTIENHFLKYQEQVRKLIAYRASLKSAGGASFPEFEPAGEPDPVSALLEIEREQRAADDAQAADAKTPLAADLETVEPGASILAAQPAQPAAQPEPEVF